MPTSWQPTTDPRRRGARFGLVWAPVGPERTASASTDKTIRLWSATSGKELGQFQASDGGFQALCFAPDGRRLISGSEDSTLVPCYM